MIAAALAYLAAPWARWLAGLAAVLVVVAGFYVYAHRTGYRAAQEDRAEAAQRAQDRKEEIADEVDRTDRDGLIDGILRPSD